MPEDVGIVVIGRNEGERLVRCLRSIPRGSCAVRYVDSGSTDGSLERARDQGVEVLELGPERPHCAARARSEGFDLLMREHSQVRYVQFIDGDCELAVGWLERARQTLEQHPDVVAVHGRVHERSPDLSPYNRLHEMEWEAAERSDQACFGGNFMVRAEAFAAIGGFDPAVIAAEDDDLALRLRRRGGRVERLADSMVLHDAAMTRFSQWWRRSVRLGHAYAQLSDMHGEAPERYFVPHESRRF